MYDSPTKELEVKAGKARSNGLWFYNIQTKKWLTPEAYIDAGKLDLLRHGENSRITLDSFFPKDPREGIRDRVAYIRIASSELQEFTDSVYEYFNSIAKDEAYLRQLNSKKKGTLRVEH
jgi:hypothetical protein